MIYDKIILLLTLLILMGAAAYAQYKFSKVISENHYELKAANILDTNTIIDLKKGMSYETTYEINGIIYEIKSNNKPHKNPITKKCKVYVNPNNPNDIKEKKGYFTVIIGCFALICVQIYFSFIQKGM